jgi:hypothetical protein
MITCKTYILALMKFSKRQLPDPSLGPMPPGQIMMTTRLKALTLLDVTISRAYFQAQTPSHTI